MEVCLFTLKRFVGSDSSSFFPPSVSDRCGSAAPYLRRRSWRESVPVLMGGSLELGPPSTLAPTNTTTPPPKHPHWRQTEGAHRGELCSKTRQEHAHMHARTRWPAAKHLNSPRGRSRLRRGAQSFGNRVLCKKKKKKGKRPHIAP